MGWAEFVAALGGFFLSHAVPVRPPVRPWLVARLGQTGFTLAYSVLSFAALAWLIAAAGRAPSVVLWYWAPWQSYVSLVVMLPVCLILALAVGRPNPFSFGGAHNEQFDPARPGFVGWMRHPLLMALALWAGTHALANGDLVHIVLFGTLGAFAALGGRLIDRRKRQTLGADWYRLRHAMAAAGRPSPLELVRDAPFRLATGLALYAALIVLHPVVFGVSPIP